jgi:hypothetical protein
MFGCVPAKEVDDESRTAFIHVLSSDDSDSVDAKSR